jgi:nucleotide-binding universal stress UspA family protein
MSTHLSSHPPVVVGVDGSAHSERALDWAATEADLRGAPLVVLQAYSPDYPAVRSAGPGEPSPPQPSSVLEATARKECARMTERVHDRHPALAVTSSCVADDPGAALVEASTAAQLVVVGARGVGRVRGLVMGSVSSHLTSRAHCPVVVVREAPSRSLADLRVVVGVDGSTDSSAALRFAFDAAARRGAGLTVVHTWDLDLDATAAALAWSVDWQQADEQERASLAEALAGYAAEFPTVDVRRHVVHAHPVAELVRQSENAALLVLGTRGRGGVKGFVLGSVSQSDLHGADCPVAVISSGTTLPVGKGRRRELHLPVPPVRERL